METHEMTGQDNYSRLRKGVGYISTILGTAGAAAGGIELYKSAAEMSGGQMFHTGVLTVLCAGAGVIGFLSTRNRSIEDEIE